MLPDPPDDALGACGPITAPSIFILICEDDPNTVLLMERKIAPYLAGKFPDARIARTSSRRDADRIIGLEMPPDVTVLDLVLEDSSMQETIACVERFDSRTAVIIVSGHQKTKIEELLVNSEVEILEKKPGFLEVLVSAIARAVVRGSKKRASARLSRMAELIKDLEGHSPHAPA